MKQTQSDGTSQPKTHYVKLITLDGKENYTTVDTLEQCIIFMSRAFVYSQNTGNYHEVVTSKVYVIDFIAH